MQHVAAAVAQQPLGDCFAALEAALRHHSTMQDEDLWRTSMRSHMFVRKLCKHLQQLGAFSNSSSSSNSRGWELPLLSLVATNLQLSAAGLAQPTDQEQQQGAGTFVSQMLAGCGVLNLAWGTVAADGESPPPCNNDSSWQGSRKLQCMAVCAVIRARALTVAGRVLEAVAVSWEVPDNAEMLALLQRSCSVAVDCVADDLQKHLIPGAMQLQLAGSVDASAAAAAAAAAGADDAPEWCAVAAAAAAAAAAEGEQSVLQQLLEMCRQLNEGCDHAAAVMDVCNDQPDLLLLSLQQLGQQLQQFGTAVCAALLVRFCRNNVQCLSLAGLSKQQQVAGRKNTCSGCKVAR
jgi:hypothetical protein